MKVAKYIAAIFVILVLNINQYLHIYESYCKSVLIIISDTHYNLLNINRLITPNTLPSRLQVFTNTYIRE